MEDEKLDNAAFYPNSSAVPREIDKAAAAFNDGSIEPDHRSCSPEQHSSMDKTSNATLNEAANGNKRSETELAGHSNHSSIKCPPDDDPREAGSTKGRSIVDDDNNKNPNNSSHENSLKLRPDTSEVNNKNVPSNDSAARQEVNGDVFPCKPTIMSNGTKLKRNDDQLNETSSESSNLTKKICNNSTKTTPVNNLAAAVNSSGNGSSSNPANSSSSAVKEPTKNGESLSDDNTETESNSDRFDSDDDDLTEEENTWDCSVCTFRNHSDAFKCGMCDVRKNFSSRKPRINPKLLVQQVAKQQAQIQQEALRASALQKSSSSKSGEKCSSSNKDRPKTNSSSLTNSSEKRKTVDLEPMSPTSSTSSSKSVKREKKESASPHKEENGMDAKSTSFTFRLKDVDRNNGVTKSITVGNLTVKITEFELKRPESDPLKKNGKKSTPNKNKFPGS